jgi:hypothetical protein
LSDKVRKEIADKQSFEIMEFVMDFRSSEYKSSLKHFEDATGFKARNWEVGYGENYFRTEVPDDYVMGAYYYPVYPEDCKGKLLFRWCLHFIEQNRNGKYYGKLIPHAKDKDHPAGLEHIYRHSKVLKESISGGWCPWTGVITDCPLVEPIVDFYLNYHRGKYSENYSLEDLIEDCFGKFFSELQSEYDYYGDNKDGCVEEHIIANSEGELFFEDGTKFNGIYEEAA